MPFEQIESAVDDHCYLAAISRDSPSEILPPVDRNGDVQDS